LIELRWARRARRDLLEIEAWYEDIEPGLGLRMTARILAAPTILRDHPRAGPPVPDTPLCKWPVHATPYLLLYRVRPGAVEIARVVDARADWHRQLR
jgi:plasmid stabilization system protein ParE